jgi:uncharacterized membrane protein YbhN (UPF0104 family)
MLTSRQKNIALIILKVAIVCFAMYSVGNSLHTFFVTKQGFELVMQNLSTNKVMLFVVVLLMPLNWITEAQKWRIIAGRSEKISLWKSLTGVLAGLATGAATPNRSGEFAGRILALNQTDFKDGVVLTFFSSAVQVIVTVLAGAVGLLYFRNHTLLTNHTLHFAVMICVCIVLFLAAFLFLKSKRAQDKLTVLKQLDRALLLDAGLWSALRYCIYTCQFFILLRVTGFPCTSTALLAAIAVNYLVITIIPTFMISEVFVRGSVAAGVIGVLCGNGETAALCALLLWLLNVGVPALAGVVAVVRMRINQSL